MIESGFLLLIFLNYCEIYIKKNKQKKHYKFNKDQINLVPKNSKNLFQAT